MRLAQLRRFEIGIGTGIDFDPEASAAGGSSNLPQAC
jgi:hypothetical protein